MSDERNESDAPTGSVQHEDLVAAIKRDILKRRYPTAFNLYDEPLDRLARRIAKTVEANASVRGGAAAPYPTRSVGLEAKGGSVSETVAVKNTHLPECADCTRSYEKWCSFFEADMTCDRKQYLEAVAKAKRQKPNGKLSGGTPCSACGGTGQDDPPPGKYHGLCPTCGGSGKQNAGAVPRRGSE